MHQVRSRVFCAFTLGDELIPPLLPAIPQSCIGSPKCRCQYRCMRVNLITETAAPARPGAGAIPVSITIRPSCGLPGDYTYRSNSSALLRMLTSKTDLPTSVLRRFEVDVLSSTHAKLLGVEMSEALLTDLGYFID